MHFILTALGSAGDVHPFAGLGWHLRQRGHRVTVLANPLFEPLLRGLDLEFVPLGTVEQFRDIQDNPDLWHPTRGFPLVVEFGVRPTLRPIYEAIRQRYVPGQTVVGAHALDYAARIAQEKFGAVVANVFLQPVVFRSVHLPPVLLPGLTGAWTPRWAINAIHWLTDFALGDRHLGPPINQLRRELGLAPVRRILHHWWYSPQLALGLFPDWFAPPQKDWPPQAVLTGFPLWDEGDIAEMPKDLAAFLRAGPPPIAFTPGSAMLHGRQFFLAAREACHRLGERAVLLTRHAEQIPDGLPPTIHHCAYAPFSQLLPSCRALVNHGGIGSVSQALAAGIPQLVMPMAHDQHDNAERLKRLGVGAVLRPSRFTGRRVAEALDRLLSRPEVQANCRRCAERIEGRSGLAQAAHALEKLGHVSHKLSSAERFDYGVF